MSDAISGAMSDTMSGAMSGTGDAPRVRLVVPCHNEARRLDPAAFLAALDAAPWLSLLFVDDGSTDDTAARLEALVAARPGRARLVRLSRNQGKAEAVRHGLREAVQDAPVCGFWDADLAAPLAEVATLRAVLQRDPAVEWVWGIRLRALGRDVRRRALRHYLGRGFATATSLLLGIDSYDTQCGAKLFRDGALLRAALAEPFRSRWIFDVELLARADALLAAEGTRALGAVVYEQPLAVWHHQPGSKVRGGDFARALAELWTVRRDRDAWRRRLTA
jgi:glycosyltransferase involved in cell wall biosynthesis